MLTGLTKMLFIFSLGIRLNPVHKIRCCFSESLLLILVARGLGWLICLSIKLFKYQTTSLNIKILLELTKRHQGRFLSCLNAFTVERGEVSYIWLGHFPASRAVFPDEVEGLMKWFIIFCCCCSVAKSCMTLWDPMDCSTWGSPMTKKAFSPLILETRNHSHYN